MQLEAAYQKVIDQYGFTWLDFDIEGKNLDNGGQDSQRRNKIFASLQKKNSGLIISWLSLPVDPDGNFRGVPGHPRRRQSQVCQSRFCVDLMSYAGKNSPTANPKANSALISQQSLRANSEDWTRQFASALVPASAGMVPANEVFGLDDAKPQERSPLSKRRGCARSTFGQSTTTQPGPAGEKTGATLSAPTAQPLSLKTRASPGPLQMFSNLLPARLRSVEQKKRILARLGTDINEGGQGIVGVGAKASSCRKWLISCFDCCECGKWSGRRMEQGEPMCLAAFESLWEKVRVVARKSAMFHDFTH